MLAPDPGVAKIASQGLPGPDDPVRAGLVIAEHAQPRSPSMLVLAMNGLPGHAEPDGNVLPRPPGPARGGDLLGLELLGQPAQPGHGAEARVEVGAAHRLLKVVDINHACQHMLTDQPAVNMC